MWGSYGWYQQREVWGLQVACVCDGRVFELSGKVSRQISQLFFSNHWRMHWRQTLRLSSTTGVCSAHKALLCMCHSRSGHVLDWWFMHEWASIMVQNFKSPFYLPPFIEESVPLLNEMDVWFRVNIHYLLTSLLSCFFLLLHFLAFGFPFFFL